MTTEDKFAIGDIIQSLTSTSEKRKVVKITKGSYHLAGVYAPIGTTEGGSWSKRDCERYYKIHERGIQGVKKTLYTRQESLKLKIPKSVAVIGVGGVGSWVASDFALSGVDDILIIDPDIVEHSNLNRTPFKMIDEGNPKVEAVMEYILERRLVNVTPIQERVENVEPELFNNYELIVDCRDSSGALPEGLQEKTRITGGYDGMNITIHINPSSLSVWGESATGYTITPSWLVPPRIISDIILIYVMTSKPRKKEYIHSINLKSLITKLLEVKQEDIKEIDHANI